MRTKNWLIGAAVVAGLIALPVACSYIVAGQQVATVASRTTTSVLQTDNILQNYDWFLQVNSNYNTRLPQIREAVTAYNAEQDPVERARLRTDLNGVRQSCRELANDYNNRSQQQNRRLFRDRNLPESLDVAACEGNAQ